MTSVKTSNIVSGLRRIYANLKPAKPGPHYDRPIVSSQKGNDAIRERLEVGSPFLAARLGSTELSVLMNYLEIQHFASLNPALSFVERVKGLDPSWRESVKKNIGFYSGFFPATDAMLERFSVEFFTHLANIDLLGVWHNDGEDLISNAYCKRAVLTELTGLEPYYHQHPWSLALKNKKVLVIHPFQDSILHQFEKRQNLFLHRPMLPDFNLQVLKAVQTLAGGRSTFLTWFDALAFMRDQIARIEFDVAIIGAGAYGLPLGSIIKEMGRQAIHLGGATQILFGIKGKRWDSHPIISSFYNDYWIRPSEDEKPHQSEMVEGGCYW